MRKYLQITVVLTVFGFFVILKQFRAGDFFPIGISVKLITPMETATPILPTPLPSASSISKPTPTASSFTPQASATPTSTPSPKPKGQYKDGTYTGSVEDAYYGLVQVQAVISNGRITDVIFLQYPNDNQTSRDINGQAMPLLKQEAISVQSANVNGVSGASSTSPAFQASLTSALSQAKI